MPLELKTAQRVLRCIRAIPDPGLSKERQQVEDAFRELNHANAANCELLCLHFLMLGACAMGFYTQLKCVRELTDEETEVAEDLLLLCEQARDSLPRSKG